jgi:hypothetical protein
MVHAESDKQLRRSNDLRVVREAVAAIIPGALTDHIGLDQIVDVVKANSTPRGGRSWHDVRDQILSIAAEWNLRIDDLEQQSDQCLRCLADLLR